MRTAVVTTLVILVLAGSVGTAWAQAEPVFLQGQAVLLGSQLAALEALGAPHVDLPEGIADLPVTFSLVAATSAEAAMRLLQAAGLRPVYTAPQPYVMIEPGGAADLWLTQAAAQRSAEAAAQYQQEAYAQWQAANDPLVFTPSPSGGFWQRASTAASPWTAETLDAFFRQDALDRLDYKLWLQQENVDWALDRLENALRRLP
jgi:hypothetical protein